MRPRGRVRLAASVLAALVAACGGGPRGAAPEPTRPHHVMVFLVDTLRADHMACYGYPRDTTPFLDDFGRRGVRFEAAASQSSWTAPSVISLFTGRDVAGEALAVPEDLPAMAELFQEAGYATAGFVLNPLIQNPENGFRRGFDAFHTTGVMRGLDAWIQDSKGRDTFTYVHLVTPHDPYGIDPRFHHFTGGPGLTPEGLGERWELAAAEGYELTDETREYLVQQRNRYDDDVRLTDSQFGTVMTYLQGADQLEDAIVVLCSDHGEGLWTRPSFAFSKAAQEATTVPERFKQTHGGQLFEELTRVPLMVWAPQLQAGRVVEERVGNVDLMPTLLELCDLPLPPGRLSGRSLAHLLYADEPAASAPTAMSATRHQHALWSGRHKLLRPTAQGRAEGLETELYDLVADPGEERDLSAERPEVAARLEAELDARLGTSILAEDSELELTEANQAAMRALGYTE